ncbi:MAG TPA: hypothetical protein VEX68_15585 [Bryobacteraceae bacterium]|nr:hypothetical protein [Bryobacteraceae bacterium]
MFKVVWCLISLPASVLPQAWLSPKGEGTTAVLYQYGIDRLHVFSDGRTKDRGHTYLSGLLVDTDFSLTDKLAMRLSLPYISGKYVGRNGHTLVRGRPDTAVTLDNGSYHGSLQDFRFDVRYSLTQGALKVVPFFQVILPSHNYKTLGHAAVGANLNERRVGVNFGRRLDPILPKAFAQGRYSFGFLEEVANVALKRSYAEFQLGYFLTRRVSVQGAVVWTYSHNGNENDYDLFPNNLTDEQWVNHDRISRAKLLDLGANISYSFNRSTSVVLGVGHSMGGANTHLRALVVSVGFVKAFTSKLARDESSEAASLPQASKALVCTCAKSK